MSHWDPSPLAHLVWSIAPQIIEFLHIEIVKLVGALLLDSPCWVNVRVFQDKTEISLTNQQDRGVIGSGHWVIIIVKPYNLFLSGCIQ